jgi:hypothetical protein
MIETEETELDAARTESVADIAGCLVRLSGASKFFVAAAARVAGRYRTRPRGCL